MGGFDGFRGKFLFGEIREGGQVLIGQFHSR